MAGVDKETNPMPNIRIVPDAGEECTVTLIEFSRRVEPPEAFFDILDQLIATRQARVTLTGGVLAEAHWLTSMPPRAPAGQSTLPLREFVGEAQLVFELPGRVHVRAASHEEAQSIITDVVRNRRKAPPGFSIAFSGDAIDTINLRLEAAMVDGPQPGGLPVRDIHLINLVERRLLGAPT
jgi:hypothetical protein